jgi:hypothetical protein
MNFWIHNSRLLLIIFFSVVMFFYFFVSTFYRFFIILIAILCWMQAPRTTRMHAWPRLPYRRDNNGKWWVLDSHFIGLISLHCFNSKVLHSAYIFLLYSILEAYRTGRGRVVVRGKTEMETIDKKSNRTAIIIKEVWFTLLFSQQWLCTWLLFWVVLLPG